jgi:cytochrome b involved in lipid metabolism
VHPGGWEILLDYAKRGEDAASEYESIKHTDDARKEAMKYLIGKVEESVAPFPMKTTGKLSATSAKPVTPTNVTEGGDMYVIYGAIAAAIVVGGYLLYKKRAA